RGRPGAAPGLLRGPGRLRAVPHRPPALRARRRGHHGGAGRAHPRRPQARLAGRQLVAGRRLQGHLGPQRDGAGLMLSRIAENLYWIGRYIERVENTARLLDVNYYAIVGAPVVPGAKGIVTQQWAPRLALTGDEGAFREPFGRADGRTVPEWLAFPSQNPSSIRSSLSRAREDARGLRDRISLEMWETLNRAYLTLCFSTERVLDED